MSAALIEAIRAKDAAQARAVLADDPAAARGAAPDGSSLVCLAVYYGQPEIAETIAAAKGSLDVFEAAVLGRTVRLRELIEDDRSQLRAVAPDGFFPLGLAAYFKQQNAVRLLLDMGADVHQTASNPTKVTALHAAVSAGQHQIAQWLVEAGADVNARQQIDYTPLMGAAANARMETLELLLAHGADPSMKTTEGKTAADLAREHGHGGIADRLDALAAE
ncbi:MAG TPA: ankyrin repeat domain-containing protein [Vicinamibacterales bacterium]|nr:ankyrin repeat domain-containing protein [Vicinamibacterales bacterium]